MGQRFRSNKQARIKLKPLFDRIVTVDNSGEDRYYVIPDKKTWNIFIEYARRLNPYEYHIAGVGWCDPPKDFPFLVRYEYIYGDCGADSLDCEFYTIDDVRKLVVLLECNQALGE